MTFSNVSERQLEEHTFEQRLWAKAGCQFSRYRRWRFLDSR